MNNLIKFASIEINKSNDIIRTAGILRMLKNKLYKLFDPEKAKDIEKMLSGTTDIKSQLVDTYRTIKNIESAINDLDVVEYNANLDELKSKLNLLNDALKNVDKVMPEVSDEAKEMYKSTETFEEKAEEAKSVEKEQKQEKIVKAPEMDIGIVEKGVPGKAATLKNRIYTEKPDWAMEIYKGAKVLADIGVKSADIKPNKNTKQMLASWALNVIPKNEEEAQELIKAQDLAQNPEFMKKAFFDKIPNMKITKINGREMWTSEVHTKPTAKRGCLEISVVGNLESLPAPLENWGLLPKFILVDNREKPGDALNYTIYRQYILQSSKGDITFAPTPGSAKKKSKIKSIEEGEDYPYLEDYPQPEEFSGDDYD